MSRRFEANLPNTIDRLADQHVFLETDFQEVVRTNRTWFEQRKAEGVRQNGTGFDLIGRDGDAVRELLQKHRHLNNHDLRGKDLRWANLSRSTPNSQDFFGYHFNGADLRGDPNSHDIALRSANLIGAQMRSTKLDDADLRSALLIGVDFSQASLSGANLATSDLRWASFEGSDLSNADFMFADLAGVLYEPKTGTTPSITSLVFARNLFQMRYENSPAGLLSLREELRKAGLRQQERQITCAIKRTQQQQAWGGGGLDKIGSFASFILFDLTTAYGMRPWRALVVLLLLIPIFSLPYAAALRCRGRSGIWVVRTDNAVRKSQKTKPVRVAVRSSNYRGVVRLLAQTLRSARIGLYFSLLTAFSVGFRDVNVGVWIARLQSREYTLRPTGWVRSVSGLQSLISVYLMALWILTYFGRPFDS